MLIPDILMLFVSMAKYTSCFHVFPSKSTVDIFGVNYLVGDKYCVYHVNAPLQLIEFGSSAPHTIYSEKGFFQALVRNATHKRRKSDKNSIEWIAQLKDGSQKYALLEPVENLIDCYRGCYSESKLQFRFSAALSKDILKTVRVTQEKVDINIESVRDAVMLTLMEKSTRVKLYSIGNVKFDTDTMMNFPATVLRSLPQLDYNAAVYGDGTISFTHSTSTGISFNVSIPGKKEEK